MGITSRYRIPIKLLKRRIELNLLRKFFNEFEFVNLKLTTKCGYSQKKIKLSPQRKIFKFWIFTITSKELFDLMKTK